MPARITIACEHCGAKLTLADDSKIGKKIKCPKCSEVFVAATDDDELEEQDDDAKEEDDEDDRPRKKSAAAAAGKGKKGKGGKGKKASGGNMGLVIGGAVAVGVLLIGGLIGVLFATGVFGGAPKSNPNQIAIGPGAPNGVTGKLLQDQPATPAVPGPTPDAPVAKPATPTTAATPTATPVANPMPPAATPSTPGRTTAPETAKWLPPDAEMVIHIRIADILGSPLVTELIRSNQLEETINAPLPQIGLKLADVESITIGMSGLEQTVEQATQAQMAVLSGEQPQVVTAGTSSLGVVKLKQPVSYELLLQAAADAPLQKVQFAGKEYLEANDPRAPTKLGVWLPQPTEVVFGDEASLKTVLEKGAVSAAAPAFAFVDWTDHLTFAVAPKNPDNIRKLRPPESTGNPLFDQMITTFVEGTNGVSLGLTIKGGVELEVAFSGVDESKTDAIVKSLNDAVGLGKLQYDQSKKDLPPWAVTLTDQLMSNTRVSGESRFAVVSTQLPDSAQSELVQLPAKIMTQILLGGMLGGDSGLGGASMDDLVKRIEIVPDDAPENVKLSASLIDIPMVYAKPGTSQLKSKKKERAIYMTVTAHWTGDKEGCLLAAAGKLKSRGGESADGKKIKVALTSGPGNDVKPKEQLQPIMLRNFGQPEIELGQFLLTISEDEFDPLKSVSGACTLVTGTQVKLATIPNIRDLADQEIEDEDLKAAGLKVSIVKAKGLGAKETITVSVKEGYLLSSLEAIDGSGEVVSGADSETDKNERSQKLVLYEDDVQNLKDLGVRAYLYSDLKEVVVPFKFEEVEIPKALEPQKTDQNPFQPLR